jgi:hypothetical protein
MGDGLAAAFQTASADVSCAMEGQRLLDREAVEAELRDDDYFGTAIEWASAAGRCGSRWTDTAWSTAH